jgi:hypothetical protein
MDLLTRWCLVAALAAGAGGLSAARPQAQGVPAHDLTAAFLFNFVRFTTWPPDALPAGTPIVVCVSGDDLVAASLEELTRDQRVGGRSIAVRRRSLEPPLEGCHVVYGAALDAQRAQNLIRVTSGRPILTVSNSIDFAARGGIANFFMDGSRMRFAVNPGAASQAQLQISSRLLSLARIVPDAGR